MSMLSRLRAAGLVASIAVVATLTTACGGGSTESSEATTGETVVIAGTMNGEVTVPAEPERVVALWNVGYQLDELGVTPVGVLEQSYVESELSPEKWDELSAIPTIGNTDDLDIDAIIELDPDVIVTMDNGLEFDYNELNAIAPTVSYYVEGPGDVWDAYEGIADAVGKGDVYDELSQGFDDGLAAVSSEFAGRLVDAQSIYVDAYQEGSAYVYTTRGLAAPRIEAAGFPYDQSWDEKAEWYGFDLDFELISDLAPNAVIFYSADKDGEISDEFTAALLDEPAFQQLPAVQAGHLYPYRSLFVYTYEAAQRQVDDLRAAAEAYAAAE